MQFMKKTIGLLVTAAALTSFTACSSPAKEPDPAPTPEQVQQTAQPVQTQTPVNTPELTPVPSTPEPEAHGPYTDPAAFAGFDAYETSGKQVVFGTTTYGDVSQYLNVQKASQFADDANESVKDPDSLQPGATGRVITDYYAKTGGQLSYILYNPSDTDAAFEDCLIVGVQDEEGMKFSNGIDFWTITPDQLIGILGEPYEIKGKYSETSINAQFIWRDESNDHQLTLTYYDDGQVKDVNGMSYYNLSTKH